MKTGSGWIGHNGGPSTEPGARWRRHCWTVARAQLLPTLPIEVVRTRVRRAAALGLDYRTYAGVRAQTGHDVVAFLFSSNALRVLRAGEAVPTGVAAKLSRIAAGRVGLAVAPLSPETLAMAAPELDASHPAPVAFAGWRAVRQALRAAMAGVPGDRVVLVAAHAGEAEWAAAGRLAGVLRGEAYFSSP